MTVRCPKCATRYRLPARSRLGRNPSYRCTRCRHVFAPDEEAEAPALEEDVDDVLVRPDDDDDDDDAPVFTIERRPEPDEDDVMDDDTVTRPRREVRPAGPPSAPRFAAWASLLVALTYGVISIYLQTHPASARDLFGKIPFIGDEMTEARLHPANIQLADVHGEFKRVHGDRLVFVITGTAINNAPTPVAGVQIQGRVMGAQEQTHVVYCGAAPQDVTELGAHEIELLQTLKPSSDWVLRSGEQDRFLVAFVDPPAGLREFAVEVVAVRGAGGRPDNTIARRP
jgi:predicted Zn finger-like uncharacterized protein